MADRTLYLALKAEYFDAIQRGEKTEEYRLVTSFWRQRLEGGKAYTRIVLTKGYPARADHARRIERPFRGFTRKTITHPHFGRKPVEVYAIRLTEAP